MRFFYLLIIIFAIFAILIKAGNKKIVCIYQIGSHSRHWDGNFQVENIDPFLCTHLVYAYFGINKTNNLFASKDPDFDLEEGRGNIKKFHRLKHQNKNLKTIAAVGGWQDEPSSRWSNMASNRNKRTAFILSAAEFIVNHDFDGIMLYWCFPGVNGDQSIDKDNFSKLVQEFNTEFDKRNLLVSVAVHAIKEDSEVSYDIPKLSEYADFIYMTGFDLYGHWFPYTGISTALYPGNYSADEERNVDVAVSHWIDEGASPEKLILGVGLFGRTFTLRDPNQTLPGAIHLGFGRPGKHTTEPGIMGYNEFCALQIGDKWTLEWDDEQKVPYAYKDSQWIGYENPRSVAIKAQYVNERQLAGIGASFVEDDDFSGICGTPYPLLNTMKSIIQTADSIDVNYIINLSIFKKCMKYKNTQMVYHSSETLHL